MRILSYILILFILILGISFACLNAEPVLINYYVGKHSIPLSLLLVLTFAVGCIVGLIAGFFMYLKQRRKTQKINSRVKIVEKEIANLRSIPLKDSH